MKYENGVYTHSTLEEGYDFYITDRYKRKYHFKIASFILGNQLVSEAWEVVDGKKDREPYIFQILSDFEEDEEYAEMLLKARIKKAVNKRYLKMINGKLQIGDNNVVCGRIDHLDSSEESVFNTQLVIDGRSVPIEKFVDMLEAYGSFNFKFEIFDPSDDIPE